MTDPYGDFFARDHLASQDFAQLYGIDKEVTLHLHQFGTKDVRIFDGPNERNGEPKVSPKPIVWFAEHPDLPMFVNKTNHERLLARFGFKYWLPEKREEILYAPVRMMAWIKYIGRDQKPIVEMAPGPYTDHRAPLGVAADRIRGALIPLGFTREKLRRFIQQSHPAALATLDATERIEDLPVWFAWLLDQWRQEAKGDIGTPRPTEPAPPAPKPAPKPKEDHGGHPSGFPGGSDYNITKDDIPF